MPPGKCELWHDPQTDAYVLAHVQDGGKVGKPRSHGLLGGLRYPRGVTEMTERRRVNSDAEPGAVLEKAGQFALRQGQTRGYASGVIHSTAHSQKAWVIRLIGTVLEAIRVIDSAPRPTGSSIGREARPPAPDFALP